MIYAHRARRDLRRAKSYRATTLRQVLKHGVVFNERRVASLAVCMPRMDKQCSSVTPSSRHMTPRDNAFGVYGP